MLRANEFTAGMIGITNTKYHKFVTKAAFFVKLDKLHAVRAQSIFSKILLSPRQITIKVIL